MITYEDLDNWRAPCGSQVLHMPHESAFRPGNEFDIVSSEFGDKLYGRTGSRFEEDYFFGVTVRDGAVRTVFVYDWRHGMQALEADVPDTIEELEAWLRMTMRLLA